MTKHASIISNSNPQTNELVTENL